MEPGTTLVLSGIIAVVAFVAEAKRLCDSGRKNQVYHLLNDLLPKGIAYPPAIMLLAAALMQIPVHWLNTAAALHEVKPARLRGKRERSLARAADPALRQSGQGRLLLGRAAAHIASRSSAPRGWSTWGGR